jgi:uncharacterized protein involved in type VI secretion and phage assembly
VSTLIDTLREIVRQEMDARRQPELGLVLEVFPGDGGEGNHQADVRLRQSGLTLRRVPVAVARPGVSLLPRVGDPAIVVFLGGDLAQPVVIGSIYSSDEQPPEAGPLEAVYLPSDAEESGVRRVHLQTPSGGTVTLDDETLSVVLGGTEMVIAQDGDVTIRAAGSISLAADGDVSIEAGGSVSVTARQDVKIEAQANFQAKATAAASLESSASGKLKAANLTIAGLVNFSAT